MSRRVRGPDPGIPDPGNAALGHVELLLPLRQSGGTPFGLGKPNRWLGGFKFGVPDGI
jgi:hypothetical protein